MEKHRPFVRKEKIVDIVGRNEKRKVRMAEHELIANSYDEEMQR